MKDHFSRIAKRGAPWCLLLTMGCEDTHVGLRAPPRTAPLPDRIASYRLLRDESRSEIVWVNGSGQEGLRTEGDLNLANGTKVYDPGDILPVVSEDSAAAKAAREYKELDGTIMSVNYFIVGGVCVGIGGFAAIPFAGEKKEIPLIVGIGAFATNVAVYLATIGMRQRYHEAGRRAFAGYRDGLQRRLGVCEVDKTLVDCDLLAPVPSAISPK